MKENKPSHEAFDRLHVIVVFKCKRVYTRIHTQRLANSDTLSARTDSRVDVLRYDLVDW